MKCQETGIQILQCWSCGYSVYGIPAMERNQKKRTLETKAVKRELLIEKKKVISIIKNNNNNNHMIDQR